MAYTGSFNGHTLGDYVEPGFPKSSDARSVINDAVAGKNAQVTRDRGGGKDTVTIQFNYVAASVSAAAAYRSTLRQSMGNAKADIVIDGATYAADMLCTSLREQERYGTYVVLVAEFEGSTF